MKTIRILLLILAAVGFFRLGEVQAQAVVITRHTIYFYDKYGVEFASEQAKSVVSASGNILKTAIIQLPEGHYLIPASGIKAIRARIKVLNDVTGEMVTLTDEMALVTRNGELKISFHLNGAGASLPNGW
ncbi:MAG TPA: hypothetical protein PK167_11960 [Prolixibacteraceae bacterium]|nr:hypothetical protein [Prolixibacteraceae bacterium]